MGHLWVHWVDETGQVDVIPLRLSEELTQTAEMISLSMARKKENSTGTFALSWNLTCEEVEWRTPHGSMRILVPIA